MLILIISRSSSKLGHVRSKTRSLDQILEKLCVHSGLHSFVSNVINFVRMLIIIISRSSLKLGHVGSKTRLLGQQATQVSDLGPLWPSCFSFSFFFFFFLRFCFASKRFAVSSTQLTS